MKVRIVKASDWRYIEYRIINTLEDLLKLKNEYGASIILQTPICARNEKLDYDLEIQIYDDYIE